MITTSPRNAGALAAALGCLLAAGVTAQSEFTRALPANTMALFEFPDIVQSLDEMQNAPIAKMWHEQEVQDFLADAIGMFEARWAEAMEQGKAMHEMGELPFDPEELAELRVHSIGLALTSMDMTMLHDQPMPKFGVIGHADLGDSAPVWKKLIDTAIQRGLEEAQGEVELTASVVGEVEVKRLQSAEIEIPMGINLAFVGNAIVFGTLQEEVDGFVEALQSEQSGLAVAPHYLENVRHLDAQGAEALIYMRPGAFIDFGMAAMRMAKSSAPDFPEELDIDGIDRAIAALGLRSIESIGATTAYRGDRCVGSSFMSSPKERRQGMMATEVEPIDMSLLRWIPKDAASLSMGAFDAGAIYDGIVGAMNAYDENIAQMLLGRLGELEEQFGVSLEDDLFGAFGTRFVKWDLPMASFTSMPEMAIIVEMRNRDGFLKALQKAAQMSQGRFEIEENERRGIKVYQVLFDIDMGGGGGFNPFATITPTFSFKDDYLVLASSTGDIKRAFKRMDREDDASGDIRSNPEFAPYLSQIPTEGLMSLSFSDWKAQFESFYQIGTTVLAFVPLDDEIPIDLSLLPDSSTLTQHLCGSVAWSRLTDAGVESRSVGPWGPETVALLGGLVGAGGAAALMLGDANF